MFLFNREWAVAGDFGRGDLGTEFWTGRGAAAYEDITLGAGTVTSMFEAQFSCQGMHDVALLGGQGRGKL
jgi:hypothetical protein